MLSPLRYPGGKAKLFPFFVELIRLNSLYGKIYAEPYAGGAGLALKLLSHGYVAKIELNDIDPAIACFWNALLEETEEFCALVRDTELTVEEWRRQKAIYGDGLEAGQLALGFSAYFLNRTSRSGIIEGSGPIGGYEQRGQWTIDARFNRPTQIAQIYEIARFKSSISISSEDAALFAANRLSLDEYFIYLDPPYYVKGSKLYKNFYGPKDHKFISDLLKDHIDHRWIVSYDHVREIVDLYDPLEPLIYNLQYSAGTVGQGQEVIFAGNALELPDVPGFQKAA